MRLKVRLRYLQIGFLLQKDLRFSVLKLGLWVKLRPRVRLRPRVKLRPRGRLGLGFGSGLGLWVRLEFETAWDAPKCKCSTAPEAS